MPASWGMREGKGIPDSTMRHYSYHFGGVGGGSGAGGAWVGIVVNSPLIFPSQSASGGGWLSWDGCGRAGDGCEGAGGGGDPPTGERGEQGGIGGCHRVGGGGSGLPEKWGWRGGFGARPSEHPDREVFG